MALMAGALLAAEKDDVQAAAKKLGTVENYSWKATVEGGFGGGATEGKTEKSGTTWLSMPRGDNTTVAVLKGGKGAIKTEEGWKSLAEMAEAGGGGGQGNFAGFMARRLQTYKMPAAEAADLAEKAKDLKKDGDAITGEMTEEGAKALMTFRLGGNNAGPTISGAKGSVKFWVKDGVLTKYQFNVKGSMKFQDNDRDIDRTTTVEIKDVGATKVEVPEEAKKKIS